MEGLETQIETRRISKYLKVNKHSLVYLKPFLWWVWTGCPVDMEGQNYTILTSKCKGPKYPAALCCEALLEFCCGFVDELNDMTNNCAETMFSYINLYGQYPPGLFANQCKEGKDGLSCDNALKAQAEKAQIKASSAASSLLTPRRLPSLALASTFILYLLL